VLQENKKTTLREIINKKQLYEPAELLLSLQRYGVVWLLKLRITG
jgi:hypothetical protein